MELTFASLMVRAQDESDALYCTASLRAQCKYRPTGSIVVFCCGPASSSTMSLGNPTPPTGQPAVRTELGVFWSNVQFEMLFESRGPTGRVVLASPGTRG
jgi:hypothetical protein